MQDTRHYRGTVCTNRYPMPTTTTTTTTIPATTTTRSRYGKESECIRFMTISIFLRCWSLDEFGSPSYGSRACRYFQDVFDDRGLVLNERVDSDLQP